MGTDESQKRILEQLRLGREEMPEWAEVLDLQIALLELQMEVDIPAVEVKLGAEEATLRRRQGIPLVSGRELELDWDSFAGLFRQVCQVSATHRKDLADALEALEKSSVDEPEQVQSWVAHFMAESRLSGESDPAGLKKFVLTHTLRPFLHRYAEAYRSLVDQQGWKRGYCPICGGDPDLGSLGSTKLATKDSKNEGGRTLLCSRCDTEWHYMRVGCPFCEHEDHSKIAYYPEEKGPHRLYVCDHCQRYLKLVDLRAAPGRVLLPVERVLTLGMDVAAREAGYE
jgi:FdhE protein